MVSQIPSRGMNPRPRVIKALHNRNGAATLLGLRPRSTLRDIFCCPVAPLLDSLNSKRDLLHSLTRRVPNWLEWRTAPPSIFYPLPELLLLEIASESSIFYYLSQNQISVSCRQSHSLHCLISSCLFKALGVWGFRMSAISQPWLISKYISYDYSDFQLTLQSDL